MRSIVTALLLAPALLLAVSNTPTTVLPADDGSNLPQNTCSGAGPSRPARFTIGAVDTIGGTTYDWGMNGPALRMLVRSPGMGVHALWMYSAELANTAFPDRNMRYNYYDLASHAWSFVDPGDFMMSGVNTFSARTGYGNLDADSTGAAVISAHYSDAAAHITPIVARDAAPGAGIFDYAPGDPTIEAYEWPWISIGSNGYFHLAMFDEASQNNLFYSRLTTWPNWENAVSIPAPQPEPDFPTHNVASDRAAGAQKTVITWVASPDGYSQKPGFYRETPDDGTTWSDPVDIGFPPAFSPGSETLPSWHITSLFPHYDKQNRLHIVGNCAPFVRDTNYILPVQLWHWCADNPDTWSLIYVHSPESLNAAVGYNAVMACRPSLGEDDWGNLFVAWEQFDGANYDPVTSRLRADIWYSSSTDNGATWTDGTKITDGGEVTYRFPCMLSNISDTVMVSYLIDQIAGFLLYAEGDGTNNPFVVQKWANPYAPGVQGPNTVKPGRMDILATPNPFGRNLRVSYAVPHRGNVAVELFDASGRLVKTLFSGRSDPGRYTASWDGRNASGGAVPNGIYLYRYSLDGKHLTGKVTLSR